MAKNAPHQVLLIFSDLYPAGNGIVRQAKARFFSLFDRNNLFLQRTDVDIILEEQVETPVAWWAVCS